ncbi:MAG: nucleotidyltransferase family protein [Prevotellaceae bacterium]|jgi:NDP-sugar pyrophosphorylase family protein|nr:nucleotidyltransferase family protein [Prevotellaceae bacterium]
MKAFILAAGLGTRLKPYTDSVPKALVPVNGMPLLERNLKYLAAQGITEFVVNVHHFADKVVDFLRQNNNLGLQISISDERDLLLETGGGLRKAALLLNNGKPFLIYNVDIISSVNVQELYKFHVANNALATLAVNNRTSSRYFLFDSENRLCGWKNTKTGEIKQPVQTTEVLTPLAFGGIHVVSPEIFPALEIFGEKFPIADVYLSLANTQRIFAYDIKDAMLLDVGKPEALMQAEKLLS